MDRIRRFIARYEHQLSIGSFIVGFIIDSITLKRIDLLVSNVIVYGYLVVVIVAMTLLHIGAVRPRIQERFSNIYQYLPFVAQFAFGGMFSGFLIFYSQSGSLWSSWPFVAMIVALIFTNEFLRAYHARLAFQATLLFFCFFSFAIYTVPLLVGAISETLFVVSGGVALLLIIAFVGFLSFIGFSRVRGALRPMGIGVVSVYILINLLYFTNILPPIPLAPKAVDIYHQVHRSDSGYAALDEKRAWWDMHIFPRVFTIGPNESLFAYSSVFAPTRLTTSIVHEWQRFDLARGGWVTESSVIFGIAGGRDGGYRGYSEKTLVTPGDWRVNVETERGQLIGRVQFRVVQAARTPALETRILE